MSIEDTKEKHSYRAVLQTDLYCNYILVVYVVKEDNEIKDREKHTNKELFDWKVDIDLEPSTRYYDIYPEWIPPIQMKFITI